MMMAGFLFGLDLRAGRRGNLCNLPSTCRIPRIIAQSRVVAL